MSRIVVTNHGTLDGVMQTPAAPDEDRRGGYEVPVRMRGCPQFVASRQGGASPCRDSSSARGPHKASAFAEVTRSS
jgi:hypothetical protein